MTSLPRITILDRKSIKSGSRYWRVYGTQVKGEFVLYEVKWGVNLFQGNKRQLRESEYMRYLECEDRYSSSNFSTSTSTNTKYLNNFSEFLSLLRFFKKLSSNIYAQKMNKIFQNFTKYTKISEMHNFRTNKWPEGLSPFQSILHCLPVEMSEGKNIFLSSFLE